MFDIVLNTPIIFFLLYTATPWRRTDGTLETSSRDANLTFQYDVVESHNWDALETFHQNFVGCFI